MGLGAGRSAGRPPPVPDRPGPLRTPPAGSAAGSGKPRGVTFSRVRYDPAGRTTTELLADWAAVMRELRHRDVIRTNNNPVGDIAEAIVAAHYGGVRGSFVQAGWDVRLPDGELVQVKAMRMTATGKRRNLSPIRDSDYDAVVIVIFDEDFRVTEGLKLTRKVVEELFQPNGHVNGRIITVTDKLRGDPRVESVDLSGAAQRLNG